MSIPSPLKPEDRGECAHLMGCRIPSVLLPGTDENDHQLRELAADSLILYIYPATGRPGIDPGPNWDDIPGAPGCTVQSLGFQKHCPEFQKMGFLVVGLSAQTISDQLEFKSRKGISQLLLSDPEFKLAKLMGLHTFEAGGKRFYTRVVFIIRRNVVKWVFYPVFPPEDSAATVLEWVRSHPS